MAMWPSEISIGRDKFKESPPNRVIRSDMDVGPAKIRRRTTAAVRNVEFPVYLTDEQLEIFDNFYLENDTIAFDFIHPRTKKKVRARFVEPPTYDLNETIWEFTVKLEILP